MTEKLHTAEDACDQASLALSAAEKEAQELLRRLSGDPDEELCDALKAAADRAERRRAEDRMSVENGLRSGKTLSL